MKVTPKYANYFFYPSCKPSCVDNGNLLDRALYFVESSSECYRHQDGCLKAESSLTNPSLDPECLKLVTCSSISKCDPNLVAKFDLVSSQMFDHRYKPSDTYNMALSTFFDYTSNIDSITLSKVQFKASNQNSWSAASGQQSQYYSQQTGQQLVIKIDEENQDM